jgi:Tfp pilus assembly protein PilZ
MASVEKGQLACEEKRMTPRTPLCKAVNFAAKGEAYEDFIQDISAGGIFIETRLRFVIGQSLSITLPMPGHQHFIQVSGQVVRISSSGIGVKFAHPIQELLGEPAFPDFD